MCYRCWRGFSGVPLLVFPLGEETPSGRGEALRLPQPFQRTVHPSTHGRPPQPINACSSVSSFNLGSNNGPSFRTFLFLIYVLQSLMLFLLYCGCLFFLMMQCTPCICQGPVPASKWDQRKLFPKSGSILVLLDFWIDYFSGAVC